MALLASLLAQQLAPTIAGTDTFAGAADGWAGAYAVYGQGAMAGVAVPVFTGLERVRLASLLEAAFQAGIQAPGTTPQALEAAFMAFWLTPPVPFGAGVVSLAPPGLAGLLAAIPMAATAADAAVNLADALDTWTRTVTVLFPGGVTATLL